MLNQYFGKRGVCLPVFKMVVSAIDPKLICRKSTTRAAIPILPMPAATFCFFLNLLIPGLGKLLLKLYRVFQQVPDVPKNLFKSQNT